ncbi:ionotropic receptor 25a-like [Argiope bruennichi]|uniref:ionotropic receptor 25a-like n=1 Tax=Argiope bruennichi TaxID=94029 RepID=UPI0024959A0C|nr:ionotropic receptor 25a-like [Argiope bruennichi]
MSFPSSIKVTSLPVTNIIDVTTNEKGDQTAIGVEGRLLNTLAAALNFSYEFLIPSDFKLGLPDENGNWSGLMGLLQRGEADIGVGGLGMLNDRLQVVDFSQSYMIQRIVFLLEKPGSLPASSQIKLFLQFFGSVLRQSLDLKRRSLTSRFLVASWLIFGFIISSSYSACLLSYLSLPLQGKPITTFVDLAQAVKAGTHRCLMLNGAPSVLFLTNAENEDLKYLGNRIMKDRWYYEAYEIMDPEIVASRTAVVNTEFNLQLLLGKLPPNAYLLSEDALISFKFGFALRKGFCCGKRLNTMLSWVLSAGLIQKYQSDEWWKIRITASKKFPVKTSDVQQLQLKDLIGVFLILVVGHFLSFVALLAEIMHFQIRK